MKVYTFIGNLANECKILHLHAKFQLTLFGNKNLQQISFTHP